MVLLWKSLRNPRSSKNNCFYNTKDLGQKYFRKNLMVLLWKSLRNPRNSKTIVFTTQKTWGENNSGKKNGFVMEITQQPPMVSMLCNVAQSRPDGVRAGAQWHSTPFKKGRPLSWHGTPLYPCYLSPHHPPLPHPAPTYPTPHHAIPPNPIPQSRQNFDKVQQNFDKTSTKLWRNFDTTLAKYQQN